ncbi:MAG: AMIN domain-containing protein [Nitrospiraceae bacterium]|nr:MAG: AMIN domain-containing protein [Nitrospiraceae bacterium]
MNVLYVILSCLLLLTYSPEISNASSLNNGESLMKIRAFDHGKFLRIVLEGPEVLIGSGKVEQGNEEINVKFSETDFTIEPGKMKLPYQKNNDTVIIKLKNPGDIKVFSLDEPSRLVIDIHKKTQNTKEKKDNSASNKDKTRTVNRDDEKTTVRTKDANLNDETKKRNKYSEPVSFLGPSSAEASTIRQKENTDHEKHPDDNNTSNPEQQWSEDGVLLPDTLKKAWEVMKKENNPFRAIAQLSSSRPSDAAYLAPYHLLYGDALFAAGNYLGAIEQLRLAYVHASDEKIKEVSFFRRAEVYSKLGFYYEAKLNYLIFIRDFPSSKYIQKAHLGLANSLSETGSFAESVEYYEKAGRSPEVLFNMANALQKLEKVEEARKVYANAMIADSTYPERSPETYFYLAENLRMTGKPNDARKLLQAIESGPFRDQARLSLGLIEMEEANFAQAVEYFQSIVFTRNLKVKVNALFNVSLAYLKQGKLKESIATLEDVRKKYIDSSLYDEALLVLSKLYRQEGRIKESVALLKELVYGNQPPKEAFKELEEILTEQSARKETGAEGEIRFTELWGEVGQWMLDASRTDFLLKIAEKLRPEGKPFVQLCSWLAENAQGKAKMTAALALADHYAALNDLQAAGQYVNAARETGKELKVKESSDVILRVESAISYAAKNSEQALKSIMAVKEFESKDFKLLADIISDLKEQGVNIRHAVAFFEKMIAKSDGTAEDYIRLADILYDLNEEKALEYYRASYEKDPGNEWAAYRIGTIVDMPETNELFGRLEKGDSLISRVAKTKLREINLLNKIDEVYQ